MKNKKEIEDAIEDTKNAMEDLNDRGNLTEEFHTELTTKIKTLRWIID